VTRGSGRMGLGRGAGVPVPSLDGTKANTNLRIRGNNPGLDGRASHHVALEFI
jgi:hypothetical protein